MVSVIGVDGERVTVPEIFGAARVSVRLAVLTIGVLAVLWQRCLWRWPRPPPWTGRGLEPFAVACRSCASQKCFLGRDSTVTSHSCPLSSNQCLWPACAACDVECACGTAVHASRCMLLGAYMSHMHTCFWFLLFACGLLHTCSACKMYTLLQDFI